MKNLDNRLENIFEQYRKQQDEVELPYGHKERFLRKLENQTDITFWQKTANWFKDHSARWKTGWALASVFCIAVLAFVLIGNHGRFISDSSDLNQIEGRYRDSLFELANQLNTESQQLLEGDKEDALYSISSITKDEELLSLQLPEDMPKNEKQKIIKEYYNQKMEGLRKIKIFIAMTGEAEE